MADYYTCPITQQIFKYPVLASDGLFYEKTKIKKWFRTKNTSPMTQQPISNDLRKSYVFCSMLEKFLEENPYEKENQFDDRSRNHLEYIEKVNRIVSTGKYDKMCKYQNISIWELHQSNHLIKLIRDDNLDAIKHVIDNAIDLESCDKKGRKFIHHVCRYGSLEILKYLVDKNIILESVTHDRWYPLHYACRYGSFEMIKYLVELGADIEAETSNKWKPIHFVCRFEGLVCIQYILSKCNILNTKIIKYGNETCDYGVEELVLLNEEKLDLKEKLFLLDIIRIKQHKQDMEYLEKHIEEDK